LTSIKGYAETLTTDLDEGLVPNPAFVDKITANADRLMRLVDDLLDLSALESKSELHRTLIDTKQKSAQILGQIRPAAEAKEQQLECVIDVPYVYADPGRMDQVLVNLLDNATKYAPNGARIVLAFGPGAKGDTVLRVSNSGPGIAREHHERLFERFYRVDKGRSRQAGGTGLGLAIVKHIMQLHGGTARVESLAGDGVTFVCTFPDQGGGG
jgi:two-component system phosphate regulon sensor histidine kinase PhoR